MPNESTHEFEAKVLWQGERSRLIEMTIPVEGHYKFFLPKGPKVTLNMEDLGDGNFMFTVSNWWWQKILIKDFQADDNR